MKKRLIEILTLLFTLCQLNSCNAKQTTHVGKQGSILKLEKVIPLTNVKGRIDHMAVDVKGQKVFIAAVGNNTVEAVDLVKAEPIYSIKDIGEPQGVVFIPDSLICVSSGETGECIFYNSNTFLRVNTVSPGSDADNLRYDKELNIIYAGYGNGGIAFIDAGQFTVISKAVLSGHPESFQIDKAGGRIFVNVPSAKLVEVIDAQNKTVVNKLRLTDAGSNFPMALDETNGCLFVGCRKPAVLVIYDTKTLKETARIEIKEDVDDIFYDAKRNFIYLTCGEGFIQVIKRVSKDKYQTAETVTTSDGARTSLFVPELNKIFLAVPKNGSEDAELSIYGISD